MEKMNFKPNRKFKKKYDKLFKKNPQAANLWLLLCELSNERGQVETNEKELADLMAIRFADPKEYALWNGVISSYGVKAKNRLFLLMKASGNFGVYV